MDIGFPLSGVCVCARVYMYMDVCVCVCVEIDSGKKLPARPRNHVDAATMIIHAEEKGALLANTECIVMEIRHRLPVTARTN